MLERRLPREEVRARAAERCKGFAPPPKVELPTIGPAGIRELYEAGGGEFDALETALVMSAHIQGPLDLAIAEGLVKLTTLRLRARFAGPTLRVVGQKRTVPARGPRQ